MMFMSLEEIAVLEYDLKDAVSNTIYIPLKEYLRLSMSAASKGHPDAMFEVGHYYFNGYQNLLEKNVECALYMWKKASEKGHVESQVALNHYNRYNAKSPSSRKPTRRTF